MSRITLVTGLWDIKRDQLEEGWSRPFEGHYLAQFEKLLEIDCNLIIYGDGELRKFVEDRRSEDNTQFIQRELEWFKNGGFYDMIQGIRTDSDWYSQAGWLEQSTQAKLDMYNPLVMSKMFLLNDARIFDKFGSDFMFWIDAGLTTTVHSGYFTHDGVLDKLPALFDKFSFLAFPYDGTNEIHGFTYGPMCDLAGGPVDKVLRGGFFGGPKSTIIKANQLYYDLMFSTLSSGLMGTEESLFTIMAYQQPRLFDYFMLENNGLISKFFEDVKNNKADKRSEYKGLPLGDITKTSLYVLGFNSPSQFSTLVATILEYEPAFLLESDLYLIDNSTDESTFEGYVNLCNEHGFTHLKMETNLGVCGGRQYAAEHFEESGADFMFFWEDDMKMDPNGTCRNGFERKHEGLYKKSLKLMRDRHFDFLKLSFSEFYGDNTKQWAWYNVPQHVREERWPDNCTPAVRGIKESSPKTQFNTIESYEGLLFATGEVYYCNWPQIVSKAGNKKMFLDTTWGSVYEQTWMSFMYQETLKGNLNPAILLLSPINHDRFDHYDGDLRKENING